MISYVRYGGAWLSSLHFGNSLWLQAWEKPQDVKGSHCAPGLKKYEAYFLFHFPHTVIGAGWNPKSSWEPFLVALYLSNNKQINKLSEPKNILFVSSPLSCLHESANILIQKPSHITYVIVYTPILLSQEHNSKAQNTCIPCTVCTHVYMCDTCCRCVYTWYFRNMTRIYTWKGSGPDYILVLLLLCDFRKITWPFWVRVLISKW